MISGVEGLKIKPLTTFKNDGVKRHSGIESFSTVLKSSEKKADASDKVQENSDKTDTESSSKTVPRRVRTRLRAIRYYTQMLRPERHIHIRMWQMMTIQKHHRQVRVQILQPLTR